MRSLLLASLLVIFPPPAIAHDFWSDGEPVPSWVKASCCGKADAHHIATNAIHVTPQGYRIDGLETVIPFERALPSQDGQAWGFWPASSEPSPPIYCLFVPFGS